jgi:hypothetical protein
VIATSFSLLAVAALWQGSAYLVLLVAVTAALLAFYRTYARLRGRHLDLGHLQALAASLPALTPGSRELGEVLSGPGSCSSPTARACGCRTAR